jgi:ubiquinol-cytochrome c reductase cytochrome b subunit
VSGPLRRLGDWFDERAGWRALSRRALHEPVPGGASMAYVFGSVLLFLLIVQAVTGTVLALYYSASTTDAWASVAYIQDQVTWGWFLRGLHHHGASAVLLVGGLHLLQTALYGAYKRPRELNWIVGVLLLGLLLAFALTGYLLPWDQTGYWATKVATGIAGAAPGAGETMQQLAQGGNEYGNLTLTRFYGLHVLVLPALTVGLIVAHLALFRRHGVTPRWGQSAATLRARTQPFWPDQLFRDVVAMAIALVALVTYVVVVGGAGLDAPADPSSNFDARPEWYFRPLFQLLKYFTGKAEIIVALGAPVVVGGVLLALPFLDRGPDRDPRRRLVPMALLGIGIAVAVALTVISMRADDADPQLAARTAKAERSAAAARELARTGGVPAAGGLALYATAPWSRAITLWEAHCDGCHGGDGKDRKGPRLGAGYNDRAWIRGFLVDPGGDAYFGRTKLGAADVGMSAVEQTGAELDALVEMVYAETGATDVDPSKLAAGRALFDEHCTDCHTREEHKVNEAAPALFARGQREHLEALLTDPGAPRFYLIGNEMPIVEEISPDDRRVLAEWLIWLRTASPAEVAAARARIKALADR